MRTAVFGLVGMMVIGTAGCALVNRGATNAVQGKGLRSFYLTQATFQGNRALDACARGYHMASRFEILDVSMLYYDSSIGLTADDSGSGPPSAAAAYGSSGPTGWVRTGGTSRFTDATGGRGSASTNCAAWSSNSPEAYGTVAYLADRFTSEDNSSVPLWNGGSQRCDIPQHVWCIEDYAAKEMILPNPMRHRRWRREGASSKLSRGGRDV